MLSQLEQPMQVENVSWPPRPSQIKISARNDSTNVETGFVQNIANISLFPNRKSGMRQRAIYFSSSIIIITLHYIPLSLLQPQCPPILPFASMPINIATTTYLNKNAVFDVTPWCRSDWADVKSDAVNTVLFRRHTANKGKMVNKKW